MQGLAEPMSDTNSEDEPTMEEILASIRRIISDEDAPEASEGAASDEPPVAAPSKSGAAETPAEDNGNVLELTSVVNDDGSVTDLDKPEDIEPEPETEPEPEPEAPSAPPPAPASTPEPDMPGIVSDPPAGMAAGSLSELAGAVAEARGVRMGDSAKTLEEAGQGVAAADAEGLARRKPAAPHPAAGRAGDPSDLRPRRGGLKRQGQPAIGSPATGGANFGAAWRWKATAMLDKNYDPSAVEGSIFEAWMKDGGFSWGANPEGAPYTIVIRPPNVTGSQHMGHALNNTLQDITVRLDRMRGRDVLWQPGTDHAGIAT